MFAHERNHRARSKRRRKVSTVGAIVLAILTAAVLLALDPNTLCLLPMLALALPLWLRRYPGERMLAALSAVRRRSADRPVRNAQASRSPLPSVVRGGMLLACSLAVRPPPRPAVAVAD